MGGMGVELFLPFFVCWGYWVLEPVLSGVHSVEVYQSLTYTVIIDVSPTGSLPYSLKLINLNPHNLLIKQLNPKPIKIPLILAPTPTHPLLPPLLPASTTHGYRKLTLPFLKSLQFLSFLI